MRALAAQYQYSDHEKKKPDREPVVKLEGTYSNFVWRQSLWLGKGHAFQDLHGSEFEDDVSHILAQTPPTGSTDAKAHVAITTFAEGHFPEPLWSEFVAVFSPAFFIRVQPARVDDNCCVGWNVESTDVLGNRRTLW